MSPTVLPPDLRCDDLPGAFLAHIDAEREWAATRLGLDVLEDRGVDGLVTELLVPAQHLAGRRRPERPRAIVLDDRVGLLVDALLTVASAGLGHPPTDAPSVAVPRAGRQCHRAAARMTALRLRARGLEVHHVGTGLSRTELEQHLLRMAPDALLLSCAATASSTGTAVVVDAARSVGIPVIEDAAMLHDLEPAEPQVAARR